MLSENLISPLGGDEQTRIPAYKLPDCYNLQRTVFKPSHMSKFVLETLFYIFYNMPFDRWQSLAAQELVHKNWRFWEERNLWVIEKKHLDEDVRKRIPFEVPEWITFDHHKWEYAPAVGVDPARLVARVSSEASGGAQGEMAQE